MGLIEDELDEVRRCCETQVPYTKVREIYIFKAI